jgi:hypothetical protein
VDKAMGEPQVVDAADDERPDDPLGHEEFDAP